MAALSKKFMIWNTYSVILDTCVSLERNTCDLHDFGRKLLKNTQWMVIFYINNENWVFYTPLVRCVKNNTNFEQVSIR